MSADRGFSHPGFGRQACVELDGREVRLVFVANTVAQAADLAESLVEQLKSGALHLTLMGRPTSVTED